MELKLNAVTFHLTNCSVSSGCRRHWLLHCRAIRPPPNKCPGHGIKQHDGEFPVMLELSEMQSTPSWPSFPRSLRPGMIAPNRVLFMDQIELNCILMLNWIAWKKTVFPFKLRTYAKMNWMNCLKWNCFCMLNWNVWNRSVFDIETVLTPYWIIWNRTVYMFKNGFAKLNCLKCCCFDIQTEYLC